MFSSKFFNFVFSLTVLISVISVFFMSLDETQKELASGELRREIWVPGAKDCTIVVDDPKAWADKVDADQIAVFKEIPFKDYKSEFGDQPGQLIHIKQNEVVYRFFQGKMGVGTSKQYPGPSVGTRITGFSYLGDGVVCWKLKPGAMLELVLCAVIIGGILGFIAGLVLVLLLKTLMIAVAKLRVHRA